MSALFMFWTKILTVKSIMSHDTGIWVSICRLPSQDVHSKSQLYNVYMVMCMS